jgi:hypothetical protein
MQPSNSNLICLYEDRHHQIPGVKILLLTLARYQTSWPILLRFPGIPDAFRDWLSRHSSATLIEERLSSSGSYNVKPSVLLDGLTRSDSCLWLDTDVLLNGSLKVIANIPPETIVVSQDPWEYENGSTHRSSTWALEEGRSLPGPLNSAVVRVSRQHRDFLIAWSSIVSTEEYLAEQAKPVDLRNRHMLGDQDALSALLASKDFASIPVHRLRHPADILQHHGAGAYGPRQRWSNLLHGMPPLVHAMGSTKPWQMPERPDVTGSPRDYYERVYLELSPYVHYARQYRDQLEDKASWLENRTLAAKVSTVATSNQPACKGILQATLQRALTRR